MADQETFKIEKMRVYGAIAVAVITGASGWVAASGYEKSPAG
jgi:hypothetical protein